MDHEKYMTSNHYRQWFESRNAKKEAITRNTINVSVWTLIVVSGLITTAAFVFTAANAISGAYSFASDIATEFNPNELTVPMSMDNPDIELIVVTGPKSDGILKEARVLQGHGYKVHRNYASGIYYKVRKSGAEDFATESFGELIEYLNGRAGK